MLSVSTLRTTSRAVTLASPTTACKSILKYKLWVLYIYWLDLSQSNAIILYLYYNYFLFLASNIAGPVGDTIGFILVLIIMASIWCITVFAIGKKHKRQNIRRYNTQQVELQTMSSPEMTQIDPLRTLPNAILNTTLQRQNNILVM